MNKLTIFLSAVVVAGCATETPPRNAQSKPSPEALGSFVPPPKSKPQPPIEIPAKFRFITKDTTLQQVVDRVGHWDRVRGSGILYYEFDLADGSAVIVSPEWPFRLENKIQSVTAHRSTNDITLAP
jgi:hypothetical protein